MEDIPADKKSKRERKAPKSPRYPIAIRNSRDRDDWIIAMYLDPELSDRDRVILTRLALHLHLGRGQLNPFIGLLASECCISGEAENAERMVRHTLEKAEKRGWIARDYRQGRSTNYRLLVPSRLRATPDSRIPHPGLPNPGTPDSPLPQNERKRINKENLPSASRPADDILDFEIRGVLEAAYETGKASPAAIADYLKTLPNNYIRIDERRIGRILGHPKVVFQLENWGLSGKQRRPARWDRPRPNSLAAAIQQKITELEAGKTVDDILNPPSPDNPTMTLRRDGDTWKP